jgi:hypothetical protein
MKQTFFIFATILLTAIHGLGQTVQTWTYQITCLQNSELCESFHDQLVIVIDSSSIGIVNSKQSEIRERVVLNTQTDTVIYILDSLLIGYSASLQGIGDSLQMLLNFVLDSTYTDVLFGDSTTVFISSMEQDSQKIIIKAWVITSQPQIPIPNIKLPGIIPFLNNVVQLMPLKAVITTLNTSLNFQIVYDLTSNVSSQGSSILEIDESIQLKSLLDAY